MEKQRKNGLQLNIDSILNNSIINIFPERRAKTYQQNYAWAAYLLKKVDYVRRKINNDFTDIQQESSEIIGNFRNRLIKAMEDFRICKPHIYNCDELNLNYYTSGLYTYEKKGTKQVRSSFKSSKRKLRVKVLLTSTAIGGIRYIGCYFNRLSGPDLFLNFYRVSGIGYRVI